MPQTREHILLAPSGRRAGPGGVHEQGRHGRRRRAAGTGRDGSARAARRPTSSRATTFRSPRVRPWRRSRAATRMIGEQPHPGADDHGRRLHPAARASGGPAVPDAGGRRVLDLGPRHGGDRPDRAGHRQGRRGSRDRRHPPGPEDRCCTGVEMFRKLLDQGQAGDNVGVLLRGTKREDVERGQVLCKPGSITPHTKFVAEAYILTKEEGGRHTPFFTNYRPQFYFRTTDVTGIIRLKEGVEMIMPGDNAELDVELITPIAMEQKPALRHPRRRPHRRRRRRGQDRRSTRCRQPCRWPKTHPRATSAPRSSSSSRLSWLRLNKRRPRRKLRGNTARAPALPPPTPGLPPIGSGGRHAARRSPPGEDGREATRRGTTGRRTNSGRPHYGLPKMTACNSRALRPCGVAGKARAGLSSIGDFYDQGRPGLAPGAAFAKPLGRDNLVVDAFVQGAGLAV